MQVDLSKLADDLVQKFEDQWKDTAENLDAASKAFDNLEGMPLPSGMGLLPFTI